MQSLHGYVMFGQQLPGRKRGREKDADDYATTSFSEHRSKRRTASLPLRASPSAKRQQPPSFGLNDISTPAPATITPADSDSEDTPVVQKSVFSPWSSSPVNALSQMSDSSPRVNSYQSTLVDNPIYSDDMEMTDSFHLSPGPSSFQNDPSAKISGRVPTPIHSSFAPFVRSEKSSIFHDAGFADDEAMMNPIKRGRRLPSPISEGEPSPSIIIDSFGGMQMEVESPNPEFGRDTPTKKGHSRSKLSLRNWTGYGGESSGHEIGVRKSFSMGYRSDCEKCRNKVPGHFSHIITYPY